MDLLTSKRAAEYLNEELPGRSVKYWQQWLANNRNHSRRSAYRIPFHNLEGIRAAHYELTELDKFIEFEMQRQLGSVTLSGRAAEVIRAYGIGENNGGLTGRKMAITAIHKREDEKTKDAYIQLVIEEPLMVFRLQISEALDLANKLLDAASAINESLMHHKKKL
ncbi:hypothetical protein SNN82_000408 [Cronobacter sakazakii]|nr:hypothetical protein [Cronobacter sakazakii]